MKVGESDPCVIQSVVNTGDDVEGPETCAEIAQLENHQVASAIGDFTQSKLVRLGDAQGQPISTQDQTFVIIPVEPSRAPSPARTSPNWSTEYSEKI